MSLPWFRLYSEVLSDRKINRVCKLSRQPKATVLGVWVTLLALANDSPHRGELFVTDDMPVTLEEIADETGLDDSVFTAIFDALCEIGVVECGRDDDIISIPNWDKRQFKSDASTKRVKRYRERRVALGLSSSATYDTVKVLARDDRRCVYCGSQENLCVDHIVPIALGGDDNELNLVCACKKCNSGKAGRTPEQAGYTFVSSEAEGRYQEYVTVTETVCDGYCNTPDSDPETDSDSDPDSDPETEGETDSEPPSLPEPENSPETERPAQKRQAVPADPLTHMFQVATSGRNAPNGRPKGWEDASDDVFAVCQQVANLWLAGQLPSGTWGDRVERQCAGALELLRYHGADLAACLETLEQFSISGEDGFTVAGPQSLVNAIPAFLASKDRPRAGPDHRPGFDPALHSHGPATWRPIDDT